MNQLFDKFLFGSFRHPSSFFHPPLNGICCQSREEGEGKRGGVEVGGGRKRDWREIVCFNQVDSNETTWSLHVRWTGRPTLTRVRLNKNQDWRSGRFFAPLSCSDPSSLHGGVGGNKEVGGGEGRGEGGREEGGEGGGGCCSNFNVGCLLVRIYTDGEERNFWRQLGTELGHEMSSNHLHSKFVILLLFLSASLCFSLWLRMYFSGLRVLFLGFLSFALPCYCDGSPAEYW